MYFTFPPFLGLPPIIREHIYRLFTAAMATTDSTETTMKPRENIRNLLLTHSLVYEELSPILYTEAFYHQKPPAVACSNTKCHSDSFQTDYSPQCQYLWAKVLQVPVGSLSWLFSFSTRSTPQLIIVTTLPGNPCWMVSGHWVYCIIHLTKSSTVIFHLWCCRHDSSKGSCSATTEWDSSHA